MCVCKYVRAWESKSSKVIFTGIISVPCFYPVFATTGPRRCSGTLWNGAQGKVSIEDMVTGPDSINVLAMGLKTVQEKVQSANAQSPRLQYQQVTTKLGNVGLGKLRLGEIEIPEKP